jgi:DNA-binding transcriptional LysR family regulator
MDIDRIRYFHVFAETGSLVKAAEVLHISQPALSKALKLLQSEVNMQLLEAEGRGLRLTPQGEALKLETKSLLAQWLQVADKVKSREALEPTKLGTFEVFSTYFLRKLTGTLDLAAMELHEYSPGKLEEALLSHKIDIGITYIPIPKAGIDFIEVTKIKMEIFGSKKFLNQPLSEIPFVIPLSPVEGIPSKIVGLDGWPDHKFHRKISYRVSMMESALELCRQGLCISYLPGFVGEIHNQMLSPEYRLHELQCPIPAKDRMQPVYLMQRSHSGESKLFRQFAKALRTLK